ncbi:MAG TPA: hypothetical protein VK338_04025, partial [Candidatus Nitrosocosmicus sp.]|nr:hypothetical protein [Candidatus Nitrosocosmicus sp.]
SISRVDTKELQISGQNGSICVWRSLEDIISAKTNHMELEMDMEGESIDLDSDYGLNYSQTSKPVLKKEIVNLQKPLNLRVCIKDNNIDQCFNNHQLISVNKRETYRFPIELPIKGGDNLLALLALKNTSYQHMSLNIYSIGIHEFELLAQHDVVLPDENPTFFMKNISKKAILDIPKPLSKYAYYYKPGVDSFFVPSQPCNTKSSYRTNRISEKSFITFVENCQNLLFQTLPFSSNNFYLWNLQYNLASGQYPSFALDDGFFSYIHELASLHQGYPDIPFFKVFQNPEFIQSKSFVHNTLRSLQMVNAYTFSEPHPEYQDIRAKNFTIEQYSENEGVMAIKGFDVIELPTAWENLMMQPENSVHSFVKPTSYTYSQILPSLWKVTLSKAESNIMMKFKEGYDKQWIVSRTLSGALLGRGESVRHSRCDGFANCFEFGSDSLSNSSNTFYIYYVPESLSFLGWILTLISVLFFAVWFIKRPKKA